MKNMSQYLDEYKELLGMDYSIASQTLKRIVIFKHIKETGENTCYRCGQSIDDHEEMSYEHVDSWCQSHLLDNNVSTEKYINPDNIKFSHPWCNSSNYQKGDSVTGMIGVSIYLRDDYYKVYTTMNSRKICVTYYDNLEKAGMSYDIFITLYRDGKSVLNFEELRGFYKDLVKKYNLTKDMTICRKGGLIKPLTEESHKHFLSLATPLEQKCI